MQRIDELRQPPIVGQAYLVPCVSLKGQPDGRLPVSMPVPHSDRGVIPEINPHKSESGDHYHLDLRFIPPEIHQKLTNTDDGVNFVSVLYRERIEPSITWHPAIYQGHSSFDTGNLKSWWYSFQELYTSERLDDCQRCPHKGFPLEQVPENSEGVRVCPLHGLAWRKDGTLAKRYRSQPSFGMTKIDTTSITSSIEDAFSNAVRPWR